MAIGFNTTKGSAQKDKIETYFMGEIGKIIMTDSLLNLLPIAFDKSFL